MIKIWTAPKEISQMLIWERFTGLRDRAEGGAGGALASPLFCKNKNKFNKK